MERTVRQVAARVGLSERTVRYYDRIALVSPPERSSAGYRLYSAQDEGRLRFVRHAKTLGSSLDDIRALMAAAERGCCGEVVPELGRLLDVKLAERGDHPSRGLHLWEWREHGLRLRRRRMPVRRRDGRPHRRANRAADLSAWVRWRRTARTPPKRPESWR